MIHSTTKPKNIAHKRDAGAIQEQVDLQVLARLFLGDGLLGGAGRCYINPFDPDDDSGTFLVFKDYFRDVRTGDRGSSIKFIQRIKHCSYEHAIAYLEGWLDALEAVQL